MSQKGRSTLLDQALVMERLLNPGPDPRAGVVHRQQELGLRGDVFQVLHQLGAGRTSPQVSFFFSVPAVLDDERQDLVKLLAIHVFFILSQLAQPLSLADGPFWPALSFEGGPLPRC